MFKKVKSFPLNIELDIEYMSFLNEISKIGISKTSIHGYFYNSLSSSQNSKVYRSYFVSFMILILFPFYLFILLLKINKLNKNIKFDIVFEEWRHDNFFDYYIEIYNNLKNNHCIARYFTNKKAVKNKNFEDDAIHVFKHTDNINKKAIFKVLTILIKHNFLLNILKLNKKYKINFIYLFVRFLFAYIKFNSFAETINSKVLITALDFNSHLLKYEILKKHNIKVLLIQSSNRLKKMLKYKASDVVYCYGEVQGLLYGNKTNKFKKIKYKGSIKNSRFLNKQYEKRIDILFIEQYYDFSTLNYASNKNYFYLLQNLVKFSHEYPNLNITFLTRTEKYKSLVSKEFKEKYDSIIEELKNSNINFSFNDDSYEMVAKSKITVSYYSALCFESLGLDVPSLFCYPDNENFELFDFIKSKDDILLRDTDFDNFKTSILELLNNKRNSEYFNKYKPIYMNQSRNYINDICDDIKKLISFNKK